MIPIEYGMLVSTILFVIGLYGVMARRNLLFILMSLEVMMNAVALAFVCAGSAWSQADGQVMFILVLTVAACEACVGLALVLKFFHRHTHLDIDAASEMKK